MIEITMKIMIKAEEHGGLHVDGAGRGWFAM